MSVLLVLDVLLLAFVSRRIARRWFPDDDAVPVAFAVGLTMALQLAMVLATTRTFRPFILTGSLTALAAVAYRAWRVEVSLGAPEAPLCDASTSPARGELALRAFAVGVPALLYAPRLLRAIASPPRAWDALTYHLPRAAAWVQDGGFVPRLGPDAIGYYEFFPPVGELPFALSFLGGHGDTLLFVALVVCATAAALGTFTLARALDADVTTATLASAALSLVPCMIHTSTAAYVDTLFVGLTAYAVAFAIQSLDSPRPAAHLVLGLATAGAASACKPTALPWLVVALAMALVAFRARRIGRTTLASAVFLGVLPAGLFAGYALKHTGSPTYPFALRVAGITGFEGNALLARTLSRSSGVERDSFLELLFVDVGFRPDGPHLNLGLGGALLLMLGASGYALRRDPSRARRIALLFAWLVPFLAIATPATLALRTDWGRVSGRLLAPSVAIAASLATTLPRRIARPALAFTIVALIPTALPFGIPWAEIRVGLLPCLLGVGWLLVGASVVRLEGRRLGLVLAVLLVATTPLVDMLDRLRASTRYALYAAGADDEAYDFHPVPYGRLFHAWRALDGARPERIAFATGFDPPHGHLLFRYPFAGRRLQNRIVYVPATVDGSIPDHDDDAPLDADVFADRLVSARITALVFAQPMPREAALVAGHPRFPVRSRGTGYVIYRPQPRPSAPRSAVAAPPSSGSPESSSSVPQPVE